MPQKRVSKVKKKARLEAKEVDNNKKAGDDKNAGNDKDAGPPAPTVAVCSGLPTPVTTSFGPLALVAVSLGLLAPIAASSSPSTLDFVNPSLASITDASVAIYRSPFFFPIRPSFVSFPAHQTTPIFSSPIRVLRSTLLLLEDGYAVQSPVIPPGTSRKQLRQDIDKDNRKKLRDQAMAAIRKKQTIRFLFSSCLCIPVIKLNIE